MLLSTHFLAQHYGLSASDAADLAHRLTMAGLEVDALNLLGEALSGVVIAEVLDLQPHPNADKLRIAQVNNGQETLQIVCGAANVAVGIKVPLAQIGAKLPNGLKIKKSALRGVDSYGMLCSATELGLAESSDGLLILPSDAPIGDDIRDYLALPDAVLDINITPNRADCFSWLGLAREVALLSEQPRPVPTLPVIKVDEALPAPECTVLAAEACPSYRLRRVEGVDNTRPTPQFIRLALERAGMSSHSPVVDVTNYVMLQWGTPLHAFDAHQITGQISVRYAHEGETLTLLNEQEALLSGDTLLIADEKSALAVAGVMGGLHSATQPESTAIILESAWFEPTVIAGKARQLNLSSDSAQRFERGVDFALQAAALDEATRLIMEICGGSASPVQVSEYQEYLPKREPVYLAWASIPKRLGRDYPQAQVMAILEKLGCTVEAVADGVNITAPTWRFDLNLDVDLIEEIARVDGYDRIDNRRQAFSYQALGAADLPRRIRHALQAYGFNEAISYSFIAPEWQQAFAPQNEALRLQNPISANMAIMRGTLLPGLLQAVQYNRNRQQPHLRLFELGRVFHDLNTQPYHVAAMVSGLRQPEQWSGARAWDFYDMKAMVEALLAPRKAVFSSETSAYWHPYQSASIWLDGEKIGELGALHPALLQRLGVKGGAVYAFELQLQALPASHLSHYETLPRFPSIRRDLALLVSKEVAVEALLDCARDCIGALWQHGFCFDIYRHEKLGDKQSVALGFILQNKERTLQDAEIEAIMCNLIKNLSQKFNAELR